MTMIAADCSHITAALLASETAILIIDALPATDLCDELLQIIDTQSDIISCIAQGKHYGSDQIAQFQSYLQAVAYETNKLTEINTQKEDENDG